MNELIQKIKGKPTSVISVRSNANYDTIVQSIPNLQHISSDTDDIKLLKDIVKTLKSNNNVLFIIYKSFEQSILLLSGFPPKPIILTGSSLENKIAPHTKMDHIYVFSYVI
jgi:hypothetical protein